MRKGFTELKATDSLILLELDYQDLENACKTSKLSESICETDVFWRSHILKHYKLDGQKAADMQNYLGFVSLKDLNKYLFEQGEDVQYVIKFLVDKGIDQIILDFIKEKFLNEDYIYLFNEMRRTLPGIIINNTDDYLRFEYSIVEREFGKHFIEVKDELKWIFIPPDHLNRRKLKNNSGSFIFYRKMDVKNGGNYREMLFSHTYLRKRAEKEWNKLIR